MSEALRLAGELCFEKKKSATFERGMNAALEQCEVLMKEKEHLEQILGQFENDGNKSGASQVKVVVESCKVLKTEKENLANINAGFACAEIKAGASKVGHLKQKLGTLTKEFQSKESALVLARTEVLKTNDELKKRVAEAESVPNDVVQAGSEGFKIAELERKLRKEIAMSKKYEKKLKQLEQKSMDNEEKYEAEIKRLEGECDQFKKLYKDAHERSIYFERKFTSLQFDQKKTHDEAPKVHNLNHPEDDFRISKLEQQIGLLSQKCDEKENELSEKSKSICQLSSELNKENNYLKEVQKKLEMELKSKKRLLKKYHEAQTENFDLINLLKKLEQSDILNQDDCCFVEKTSETYGKLKVDLENKIGFVREDVLLEVVKLIDEFILSHSNIGQVIALESKVMALETVNYNLFNQINLIKTEFDVQLTDKESIIKQLQQKLHDLNVQQSTTSTRRQSLWRKVIAKP